jgi:hypothetical protein
LSTTSGQRSRSLLRRDRARTRTNEIGAAPAMTAKHRAMGTTWVRASTSAKADAKDTSEPTMTLLGLTDA